MAVWCRTYVTCHTSEGVLSLVSVFVDLDLHRYKVQVRALVFIL